MFCNRSLGTNDVIETFPVGRRLAFDAACGHPREFLQGLTRGDQFRDKKGIPGYINKMPKPTKLALEMALHEEQERRALEGELWMLEQAWREAEEIAAISDNLLLPDGVEV